MPIKRFVNLSPTPAIPANDLKAAYLEIGHGPTLLMLHGFFGDAACWLPLIQKLKSHFRCISLDLIGFGESSKPMIRYDVAISVAFVRQFVEKLGIESCYILGHSFGGWVASAYALKYPNLTQGLILTAPAGIRDDSFADRHLNLRPLLWKTPLVDWALHLATPFAKMKGKRAEIEKIWWIRKSIVSQPVARSFLISRLRAKEVVDTVEKEIHKLRLPTLVIGGDRDKTIPVWHCQTFAREIPNAKLAIISGADHNLPDGYFREIADLIGKFMASQMPATADSRY